MCGEPPSCFTEKCVKARKQHHCCECPAPIDPGEHYQKITGIWEGQAHTFKTCWPCAEVREQFREDLREDDWGFNGDSVVFGHLQSEIEDYYS